MANISVKNDLVGDAKLKKIFNDPATILFTNTIYDLDSGTASKPLELSFDYKLPVTVDTLKVTQDDPTINHYKIIGLGGDWTTSATLGDVSIQLTIPNTCKEALQMCFGTDNVMDIDNVTIGGEKYSGHGLIPKKYKMSGTLALVASNDKDVFIVTGTALYAKFLYENVGTDPIAIQINGGIEIDEEKPTFVWLTKQEDASTTPAGK